MDRPAAAVLVPTRTMRAQVARGAFAGRLITFGTEVPADVQATDVELRGLDGTAARVRASGGEVRLDTPLLGLGNLSNVLAALAIALHFGLPLADAAERASRLKPPSHRGELLRLPAASRSRRLVQLEPPALKQALATVGAATGSARKAAVLGEMLELGEHAALPPRRMRPGGGSRWPRFARRRRRPRGARSGRRGPFAGSSFRGRLRRHQ